MENIVRTNKLRIKAKNTADINNAHSDRSRCWHHMQEATKKTFSFIMTEANKALRFFSEGVVI